MKMTKDPRLDAVPVAHEPPIHIQLAALCHRKGKDGTEILLVTSSTGRWILPKGWPIKGVRPSDVALVEAWEEGGVRKGKVARKPIGSFRTAKLMKDGTFEPSLVRVFAIKADEVRKSYPESEDRDRKWVSLKKAVKTVDDEGLRGFLRDFIDAA